jgi:hypothetical protein
MKRCITPELYPNMVAQEANMSNQMVSEFLCGHKDSNRVRTALCKVLGYRSFESLIKNVPQESKGGAA